MSQSTAPATRRHSLSLPPARRDAVVVWGVPLLLALTTLPFILR